MAERQGRGANWGQSPAVDVAQTELLPTSAADVAAQTEARTETAEARAAGG